MTSLTQDIQDAIRKSLPTQTADELRVYLDQAKHDKEELVRCKASLELSLKVQMEQTQVIAKAGNLETRENLVKGKEVELLARETQVKHQEEILKIATANAHSRYNDAMAMMQVVFKSQPIGYAFSKQINENGTEPSRNSDYGSTVSTNKTHNEYTTKREITE